MPSVGLFIYDFDQVIPPQMQEVDYAFVPRSGDLLDLPDPRGGGSVYRVFAVVVAHEGHEIVADVYAEQVSPEMTPSGSYIASLKGVEVKYP